MQCVLLTFSHNIFKFTSAVHINTAVAPTKVNGRVAPGSMVDTHPVHIKTNKGHYTLKKSH